MRWFNIIFWVLAVLMLIINYLSFIHAYKLTHFSRKKSDSRKSPYDFSLWEKISLVLFGFNNPRPETEVELPKSFRRFTLKGHMEIECWYHEINNSKGTVALFHGYSGEKSGYLERAKLFASMGYNTLLVDFFGSGGSEGSHTTIGFYEAKDVKAACDYLKGLGQNEKIILFGNSMGAVAILKAVSDYNLDLDGLVLECPFGTMIETIGARFRMMKIPTFPMAQLLAFWGGVQNGFWPFDHNPKKYAKNIDVPTLMFYGLADRRVSRKEIDSILNNLKGYKRLKTFPNIGHDDYLLKYKVEWESEVLDFLTSLDIVQKEAV